VIEKRAGALQRRRAKLAETQEAQSGGSSGNKDGGANETAALSLAL